MNIKPPGAGHSALYTELNELKKITKLSKEDNAAALQQVAQQFEKAEEERLFAFGIGLQLSQAHKQWSRELAQRFLLDQCMEAAFAHGHDDHARRQVYALADRIGLDRDKAAEAEASFLRRSR